MSEKLRVFISYSRDDLNFADQLAAALRVGGIDPTIDRQGISSGEDWRRRLSSLIRDADTVVFVLSPSSAISELCGWEVDEAARLGKRIMPAVCRPLENAVAPQRLQDLNYVFFYAETKSPGSGFGSGLEQLVAALNTDIEWLREHTRYLQRATEWDSGGRPENRLLSGADVGVVKAGAARRPKDAPEPTELHLDFIRASENWEARQQSEERRRLEEMARAQEERARALADTAVAQKREAEASKRAEVEALRAAEEATRAATAAKAVAKRTAAGLAGVTILLVVLLILGSYTILHSKAQEENSRARELTAYAALSENDDPASAIYLGLSAARVVPKSPPPGLETVLPTALLKGVSFGRLLGHTDSVHSVACSPDGKTLASASWDRMIRLWDAASGKVRRTLSGHTDFVLSVAWSPDGKTLASASADQTIRLWDAASGQALRTLSGHTSYAIAWRGVRMARRWLRRARTKRSGYGMQRAGRRCVR